MIASRFGASTPSKPVPWVIAGVSLASASVGYVLDRHADLAVLAMWLLVLNLVLLVFVAYESIRTRIPGKGLLIASTVFFFWIGAATGASESPPFGVPSHLPFMSGQFDLELIRQAFLYVSLFQLMLLVGYSLPVSVDRLTRPFASRVDADSIFAIAIRCFFVVCAWLPLLMKTEFDLDDTFSWVTAARSAGPIGTQEIGLAHHLFFFGIYGAAYFLTEAIETRSVGRMWRLVMAGVALVPCVASGTRHFWLFVALPVCVRALAGLRGGFGPLRLTRWAVAGIAIVLVAQLQLVVRPVGWRDVGDVSLEQIAQKDVTGQFTALLVAEALVPGTHPYFFELAEPYFLLHWVPRQFWPSKPVMRSWEFYNDVYTGGADFNVTPSVIGQFHINWGIAGVLAAGLWLGLLTRWIDRLLLATMQGQRRSVGVCVGLLYAFVVSSFRFYSPGYFTFCAFGVVGALLTSRAVTRREGAWSAARDDRVAC
jgi:hypothetical protein